MFQFKTVPTVPTTSTTELVEINVGGKKFATTLKTIQAIPFFKNNAKEIPTIKTRVPPSARTIQQQPQVNPFQTPVVTPIQPQIVQPPQEKTFSFQDFLSFDPEGNLFVDLNGELFECILDWIRYGNVPDLSINHLSVKQLFRLKKEALFYGLTELSVAIANRLTELGGVVHEKQPQQTTEAKSNVQLLKVQAKYSNQPILSVAPGVNAHLVLTDAKVEFEMPQKGHILVEYSIADSCGDYVIVIDEIDQRIHPALSGLSFEELTEIKTIKFDYAMTQHITFISPTVLTAGKHTVSLKWKPYQKTGYNIQGPLIAKVYFVDEKIVQVKL